MSLERLVLTGVASVANLCNEALHGDPRSFSKQDRQNAVQYIHGLKSMLKQEKSGNSVVLPEDFRKLVGYFSNYFINEAVKDRKVFHDLCDRTSLFSLFTGCSGIVSSDESIGKVAMGAGFGCFLLSEFMRFMMGGVVYQKELNVTQDFAQILKPETGDDVWRKAVSKIRYEPRRYLVNGKWYE
jgi:hypothetical protein